MSEKQPLTKAEQKSLDIERKKLLLVEQTEEKDKTKFLSDRLEFFIWVFRNKLSVHRVKKKLYQKIYKIFGLTNLKAWSCLVRKKFGWKNFVSEIFFVQYIFGQKNLFQKTFGPKNFVQKICGSKKVLGSKNLGAKKFLGSKH